MAIAPPELTVKIKFDTNDQERESAKLARDMEARATKLEATLSEQVKKGEAQRENIRKSAQTKFEAAEAAHAQRLRQARDKHFQSMQFAEEKAQARSLRGMESWSARMTKSLDQVVVGLKAYAAAWTLGQLKNAIAFTGSLQEQASGLQITSREYFALSSAMRDAGAGAERLEQIFAKLNNVVGGGASDKERQALSRLGIVSPESLSNMELLDKLIRRVNSGLANQADITEIFGNRAVAAFNRVASSFGSVDQISSEYKFPITDEEIQRLDQLNDRLEQMGVELQVVLGRTIAWIDSWDLGGVVIDEFGVRFVDNFHEMDAAIQNSQSLFNKFLAQAQQNIETQRRSSRFDTGLPTVFPGLPTPVTAPSPVDAQGNRLRRTFASNDRSFQLPAISRELPTITRATEEWNQQLQVSVSLAEQIQFNISRFANSDTWQIATAGAQAFTSIMSLQAQSIQNEVDGLNRVIEMERERWQIRSEAMREAGQEGSAAYRNELREFERLDKERAKKAQQLQAKAFEVNKRAQIAGTIMNTSQAIMNALATVTPFWVGLVMSGVAAAQGSVQVAMIAGQQNPYRGYAFGGYVPGQSLGDDTMINVTGGEFVTNREATKANRAALEYANKGGLLKPEGAGGITVIIQGDIVGDDYYVENRLIPRLNKALRNGYKLETPR